MAGAFIFIVIYLLLNFLYATGRLNLNYLFHSGRIQIEIISEHPEIHITSFNPANFHTILGNIGLFSINKYYVFGSRSEVPISSVNKIRLVITNALQQEFAAYEGLITAKLLNGAGYKYDSAKKQLDIYLYLDALHYKSVDAKVRDEELFNIMLYDLGHLTYRDYLDKETPVSTASNTLASFENILTQKIQQQNDKYTLGDIVNFEFK